MHPYRSRPVGATVDWITPQEILAPLGTFDLDPCAADPMPWRTAKKMWVAHGLQEKWFGRVWLNPPYGNQTKHWLQRLASHGNGIALVFARTETLMFFEHVWPLADGVLFIKGRPKFCDKNGVPAKGNSGGPLALIAYGQENVDALRKSGLGVLAFVEGAKKAG